MTSHRTHLFIDAILIKMEPFSYLLKFLVLSPFHYGCRFIGLANSFLHGSMKLDGAGLYAHLLSNCGSSFFGINDDHAMRNIVGINEEREREREKERKRK